MGALVLFLIPKERKTRQRMRGDCERVVFLECLQIFIFFLKERGKGLGRFCHFNL
jgi:hypothetical protein